MRGLNYQHLFVGIIIVTSEINFVESVQCSYRLKNFVCLGRHDSRCPAKRTALLDDNTLSTPAITVTSSQSINTDRSVLLSTTDSNNPIRCVCGKSCKGRKGLAMHRRSCKIAKSINSLETEHEID